MIIDHVSASWSEDEILSVANNNTNVSVQYTMINDALVSNHAYGSLIRPRITLRGLFPPQPLRQQRQPPGPFRYLLR